MKLGIGSRVLRFPAALATTSTKTVVAAVGLVAVTTAATAGIVMIGSDAMSPRSAHQAGAGFGAPTTSSGTAVVVVPGSSPSATPTRSPSPSSNPSPTPAPPPAAGPGGVPVTPVIVGVDNPLFTLRPTPNPNPDAGTPNSAPSSTPTAHPTTSPSPSQPDQPSTSTPSTKPSVQPSPSPTPCADLLPAVKGVQSAITGDKNKGKGKDAAHAKSKSSSKKGSKKDSGKKEKSKSNGTSSSASSQVSAACCYPAQSNLARCDSDNDDDLLELGRSGSAKASIVTALHPGKLGQL